MVQNGFSYAQLANWANNYRLPINTISKVASASCQHLNSSSCCCHSFALFNLQVIIMMIFHRNLVICRLSVSQMGGTLCTKSVTPSRIQENFNVWDFAWVSSLQIIWFCVSIISSYDAHSVRWYPSGSFFAPFSMMCVWARISVWSVFVLQVNRRRHGCDELPGK